ncbi:MAG: DUF87 domain-containing protein [Candidatus Parvarchaeota archaeon]
MDRRMPIEQVISLLRQYSGIIDISSLQPMIERYLRTKDTEMRDFLLSRINERLDRSMSEVLMSSAEEPGEAAAEEGEFVIGHTTGRAGEIKPFKLSRDDLNRNILIAASVGHGKTSLIKSILDSISMTDIRYIIFDAKRDYIQFGMDENSFYLDSSNMKINVLEPPKGVDTTEWAMHIADVFSHSFSLLIGSRDFLLETIISLYKSWRRDYPPSLSDLVRYMESRGRSDYAKVVLGRLKAILASTDIFNCNRGLDLSKLRGYNLVFGIDSLGIAEQSFIASFVLLYLYHLHMGDEGSRGRLHRLVVIDDAHTILDVNKERDQALGTPLLHALISKMRELGIGFIFADQQLSSLLSSAVQNSNIKFIGSLGLMKDLSVIFDQSMVGSVYGLISKLKVGEFLAVSPYCAPYCVMKAKEADRAEALGLEEAVKKTNHRKDLFGFERFSDREDRERSFIQEILNNPFKNLSAHKKNLMMESEEFEEIRAKLLKSGRAYEVAVRIDDRREAKYIYMNKEGEGEEREKVMSRGQFVNRLLRGLSISKLKEENINFDADDIGILLPGIKTYIVFMHRPEEMIRLMETPFRRIVNVLEDRISEEDAMIDLIKEGKTQNISQVRFCHINNLIESISS